MSTAAPPRASAPTITPPRRPHPERASAPALIRVATLDDHWAVRAGLESVIDSQPDMALVGSVAGEDEVDRLLERTDPSLLILDVDHPGLDGLAIGLRLKRRADHPRIVLYSGREATPLLTAAAAVAGMDAIVPKSASRRELLEALRDAARHGSRIDVPLALLRHAAGRLDPADHAILAMRIAGSSWSEVGSTLAIDEVALARRAWAIVAARTASQPGSGAVS